MWHSFKQCLTLIDRRTAWLGVAIGLLILVTTAFEAFGIGLIFAFVQTLTGPADSQQLTWLGNFLSPAVTENKTDLITFLALFLLVVFIAKNAFLLTGQYIQIRFVSMTEAILSAQLFDRYLMGAYPLHLGRNSAEFIRNITGAVTTAFNIVFLGFINLVSESVMIVGISFVLILVKPFYTFVALGVLGSAISIFFVIFRSSLKKWGEREQVINEQILQSLQQGFHNIKEVKISGRQHFILKKFEAIRNELAHIRVKIGTVSFAPRLWIETVVVTGVLLAIVFMLSKGESLAEILAALTLFAAAALRMIPSMSRVAASLNNIKRGAHAVDLIHEDMHLFQENRDEPMDSSDDVLDFNESIAVKNISFNYPQGNGQALTDISLTLPRGASLGLVGPSGAGKTTLADIIIGFLEPTNGVVTVDGTNISGAVRAWRRQIGYVPQSIYIIDDTLRRNIAFGLEDEDINTDKLKKALRLAQLDDFVRELPDGLETRMGDQGDRLSGGQRQRIGIARALYQDPEVLILDEATSSLDTETEREINNAIERLSGEKTLIIIAHRLSTVRKCDTLAFLRGGCLVDSGNFEELNARNKDFSRLVELSRL